MKFKLFFVLFEIIKANKKLIGAKISPKEIVPIYREEIKDTFNLLSKFSKKGLINHIEIKRLIIDAKKIRKNNFTKEKKRCFSELSLMIHIPSIPFYILSLFLYD